MITLNYRDARPIYEQVRDGLRRLIVSGAIADGEKLPSVRELALEAGVNPNTVQRSLTELEREGLVFSQRTAGRFVTENENMIVNAKLRIADERVSEFLRSMKTLGCGRQEIISLIEGAKEDEE